MRRFTLKRIFDVSAFKLIAALIKHNKIPATAQYNDQPKI